MLREVALPFVLAASLGSVAQAQGEAAVVGGVLVADATPVAAPAAPALSARTQGPQPSGTVTIDFDDVSAPCTFIETTALRDRYKSLGVRFRGPGELDGGAIVDQCGNWFITGHSPPNFVGYNSFGQLQNLGLPIPPGELWFVPPVTRVTMKTGAGFVLTREEVKIRALGPAGNEVDADAAIIGPEMQTLLVEGPCIQRVILTITGGAVALDDLTFTQAPCSDVVSALLMAPEVAFPGRPFVTTVLAPSCHRVLLMTSAGQGPTATAFGPLALDLPLLQSNWVTMPASGEIGVRIDVPPGDDLVGRTGHIQAVSVDPRSGEVELSQPQTVHFERLPAASSGATGQSVRGTD